MPDDDSNNHLPKFGGSRILGNDMPTLIPDHAKLPPIPLDVITIDMDTPYAEDDFSDLPPLAGNPFSADEVPTLTNMKTLSGPFDSISIGSDAFQGAVISDAEGNLQHLKGDIDGETLSAVVSMTHNTFDEISDFLGMGDLESWAASGEKGSIYVSIDDEKFVAVQGGKEKNPNVILNNIFNKK